MQKPLSSTAGKLDRKSTRLNSSHANISYAVFCLKKKNQKPSTIPMDSFKRSGAYWCLKTVDQDVSLSEQRPSRFISANEVPRCTILRRHDYLLDACAT